MSNESAKGHAKNARYKLKAMRRARRKGKPVSEESIEYVLQEVEASLDSME